jgi:hypothetical protein
MSDKLTAERLRGLDEAATAGPWLTQKPSLYREDNGLCIIGLRVNDDGAPIETPTNGLVAVATQSPAEADEGDFERATANAALLTYLRNAVPTILAMAEERKAWSEAVATIMARCEALEDEAHEMMAKADCSKTTGFYSGQKMTAKSLRRELHDLTRALGKDQAS